MSDLTEFLLARYADEEAVAREVLADWGDAGPATPVPLQVTDGPGYTVAAIHPDRVLAECEAKRRIVDRYTRDAARDRHPRGDYAVTDARLADLELTLRMLALPYAEHPDFDPEWRQ